jgi:hypothetical protein
MVLMLWCHGQSHCLGLSLVPVVSNVPRPRSLSDFRLRTAEDSIRTRYLEGNSNRKGVLPSPGSISSIRVVPWKVQSSVNESEYFGKDTGYSLLVPNSRWEELSVVTT